MGATVLKTSPSAKPAAAYLRLSVLRDDSTSIQSQERMSRDAAERHGIGRVVRFVEGGVSASQDVRRPQRDDMERRIMAREFSALIVKSVDRLARSSADFSRIAKICRDTSTALIVSDLGVDSATPGGELLLKVLADLAEFEARLIGARIREGTSPRSLPAESSAAQVPTASATSSGPALPAPTGRSTRNRPL